MLVKLYGEPAERGPERKWIAELVEAAAPKPGLRGPYKKQAAA